MCSETQVVRRPSGVWKIFRFNINYKQKHTRHTLCSMKFENYMDIFLYSNVY